MGIGPSYDEHSKRFYRRQKPWVPDQYSCTKLSTTFSEKLGLKKFDCRSAKSTLVRSLYCAKPNMSKLISKKKIGAPILTNKEDENFYEALKLYDQLQYKKALKLVTASLKKNSNHASCLALKGCLNYQLGSKSEAEAPILKAIAKEPRNHYVNHLAGMYYKLVENYAESAKWMKAAVDNGSPNVGIVRDLAYLQSQIRDYKNLVASRQQYLEKQPGYRANWTSVAVAHHLNGDSKQAYTTLQKIEDIIREHLNDGDRFEQSECILYKIQLIAESGAIEKALEQLEKDESEIKDKLAFMEFKGRFLLMLNRKKEASLVYRQLIKRNPDNVQFYTLLEASLETASKPVEVRLKLFDKLATFYPKSDPPVFVPLLFLPASHPEFKPRLSEYLLSQLKRGFPATFVNLKSLYRNLAKREIIYKIVREFNDTQLSQYDPTVTVWTKFFLAQHFLYVNDLVNAEKTIDEAIKHSPTLVELYMLKARIVKHKGDFELASTIMEEGRELDLQDRFVNSKSTKYLLRAGKVDQAIETISLFTKLDKDAVNGLKDLHLMQANWVLVESAEAYVRTYKKYKHQLEILKTKEESDDYEGNIEEEREELLENAEMYVGLALKRYNAVIKVFKIFYQDQFDFHSYCLRRGTPRDYVATLKWEDKIHTTPIYTRVIKGLSEIMIEIYDEQVKKHEAQLKDLLDEEDVKSKKKSNGKKKLKSPKSHLVKMKAKSVPYVELEKDDQDPFGSKVLSDLQNNVNGQVLDLLLDLVKTVSDEDPLLKMPWEILINIYLREGKYVLALQAIRNLEKVMTRRGSAKSRLVGEYILQLDESIKKDTKINVAIAQVVSKSIVAAFPEFAKDTPQEFLAVYCQ